MKAKYERGMLQNPAELDRFIEILQRENVTSYLEIGSKFGGSLWRIANALPVGSRVVSVDLPHGDLSFKESMPHLIGCIEVLNTIGYQAALVCGDSTEESTIASVRKSAPFDAALIDGGHTLACATADWNNYGPMARIVAFHDISWRPRPAPSKKMPIQVPQLWNRIKHDYRHEEFQFELRDNGIGVLWRF